jgi:2-polyprenyl-6-methoxyphenol hydroxylase-like FAD-dependent oxidoreductase
VDKDSDPRDPPVVVVGAGPTGLLLATELARRDVDCLLIDAHDAPLDWDRATVVHARSIEIFEALGLADRFLDEGVKVRGARLRSDARSLGLMDLGMADTRYGFDLGVSEEFTESVLTDYLADHGGAVTRSARLVDIHDGTDGIVATIEQDGERRDVTTSWIVGCDGMHSTTRRLAQIDYPGTDLETPWAVFDATLVGWDGDFDLIYAHFDTPSVILSPLPHRRWRVYVRPTSETSDLVSDATTTIHRYAPSVEFTAVENPTRFQCHSRVASRFKSGRVLLAGDAAHACSPSEGHGMNTGMQDAFNLGWKLALACRGADRPGLLDSYEEERRPVALRIAASGDVFEGNQAMTAQHERTARDAEMRKTFADSSSSHHEAVAAAELDRSYTDSNLVRGDANDRLGPGVLLPTTASVQPFGGEPCALHELAHRLGHTVFVLGGNAATGEEVLRLTAELQSIALGASVDAVIGLCTRPDGLPIGRIDESVADQLGISGVTVLAIRPDRFVGFRHDGTDRRAIMGYLATFG